MSETETIVVPMPHMGVSVDEGTVVGWLKAAGDTVAAEETICEVATDKVDIEVAAPADGVLARIVVADGETVVVGAALAEMTVTAGAAAGLDPAAPAADPEPASSAAADPVAAVNPVAADPAPSAEPAARPDRSALAARTAAGRDEQGGFDPERAAATVTAPGPDGRARSSPLARRIAAEHGIAIAAVRGSGKAGRVTNADVLAHVAKLTADPAVVDPAVLPQGDAAGATAGSGGEDLPPGYEGIPREVVPTSRIRRVIAEHMSRSRQTAAHMTTEVDVDLSQVLAVRAELNAVRGASGEGKLSLLPFVARVACTALADHPDMNATFREDAFIRWKTVNLGVAVDTPAGLLVPVIQGCERLTVTAIGAALVDLAARARAKKLTPDDLSRGTFTLSNPGSVGAVSAPAIINQPQVALLGMPAIQRRPWVVRDEQGQEAIAVRSIIRLAVTFDHRAIDGADATRFAVAIKERLEDWGAGAYA